MTKTLRTKKRETRIIIINKHNNNKPKNENVHREPFLGLDLAQVFKSHRVRVFLWIAGAVLLSRAQVSSGQGQVHSSGAVRDGLLPSMQGGICLSGGCARKTMTAKTTRPHVCLPVFRDVSCEGCRTNRLHLVIVVVDQLRRVQVRGQWLRVQQDRVDWCLGDESAVIFSPNEVASACLSLGVLGSATMVPCV